MKTRYVNIFVMIASLVLGSSVLANFTEQQKITSTPRGVGAQHGNAVALSGNTMVVGARFDSTTASQAGAAFVYVLTGGTWTQQAILLANDGAALDKFGYSVAISEDTIVVGSYNDDNTFSNGGSAYVFVRTGTTWAFQQKLTPGDGTADDEFGNAVGIEPDSIVIGAHFADLPGNSQAGSAYVFRRTGTVWTQTQKLIPVAAVILGDHFGESIAVSRGKIAVGASGDDTPQTAAGAVYVYAENGAGNYAQQQKITIASGTNGDRFGNSVALEGDTLVGGAREDAPFPGQTARGSAYVFEYNGATWASQGQLLASDGASLDRFGYSVAVSNGIIAIGAREDDTAAGPDSGSAYVFKRLGTIWTQQQKLEPADPFNGDRFGGAVALSFLNLVVGAPEKALSTPNGQGAVYYYKEEPACQAALGLRPARNFGVGSFPWSIVVGDFNLDGKPDLATANANSDNLSVLFGNGRGGFQAPFYISVTFARGIAVADFNLDGKPDLAATDQTSAGVSVFLGDGEGHFGPAINSSVGANPESLVVGDFNLDGIPDLATARNFFSDASFSVVLGNGNGSFGAPAFTPFSDSLTTMVKGDFNRDGRTDLALTVSDVDAASVFSANGNGTFGPPQNFPVGDYPDSMVTGDVNLDGKLDLVTTNIQSGNYSVLLGNGAGGFAGASNFNFNFLDELVMSDLDLDGKPDLAISQVFDDTVSIFRGNGKGSFAVVGSAVGVGKNSGRMTTGDFNLDGYPDVVVANRGSSNVSLLLNACGPAPITTTPFDYDGDGKTDVSIWRPTMGTWYVARSGTSDMYVQQWGLSGDTIVPADYDGDGKTDLAVRRPSIDTFYIFNSSNSTLEVRNFGVAGDVAVPSDYNGDGKADVAVWRPSNGTWYLSLSGSGIFYVMPWGLSTDKPVPGDFDGDGKTELAVFRPSDGKWYTFSTVTGTISVTEWGINGDRPVQGDYNGDGRTDFAVYRPSNNTWYRQNSNDGAVSSTQWGLAGDFPVPGDYDGDGKSDVAVWRPSDATWYVNRSGSGIFTQTFGVNGDTPTPSAFGF